MRHYFLILIASALILAVPPLLLVGVPVTDAASPLTTPPGGRTPVEFIANMLQDHETMTIFGYLTHIAALADGRLFTDPSTRTEATAQFTISGLVTLNAHHQVG